MYSIKFTLIITIAIFRAIIDNVLEHIPIELYRENMFTDITFGINKVDSSILTDKLPAQCGKPQQPLSIAQAFFIMRCKCVSIWMCIWLQDLLFKQIVAIGNSLKQGCQTQFLEGRSPAEFRCNPN